MKCPKCKKECPKQETLTGSKTCNCPNCLHPVGFTAPPSDIAEDFEIMSKKDKKKVKWPIKKWKDLGNPQWEPEIDEDSEDY